MTNNSLVQTVRYDIAWEKVRASMLAKQEPRTLSAQAGHFLILQQQWNMDMDDSLS